MYVYRVSGLSPSGNGSRCKVGYRDGGDLHKRSGSASVVRNSIAGKKLYAIAFKINHDFSHAANIARLAKHPRLSRKRAKIFMFPTRCRVYFHKKSCLSAFPSARDSLTGIFRYFARDFNCRFTSEELKCDVYMVYASVKFLPRKSRLGEISH